MSLMASGGIVPAPTTRRRGKLPKDVVDHLTQWLMEHRSHPYPNEEEKRRMCHATNLNISQVSVSGRVREGALLPPRMCH